MFAVFEDGGRQYRVQAGDKVKIDYREAAKVGDAVSFDRILAAGTDSSATIGRPVISGAVVEALVLDREAKGPKLEVGKFRRRKGIIRHNGHTQKYTAVEIKAINVPGL